MKLDRRQFLMWGGASAGLLGWPVLNTLTARAQDGFPLRLLLVYSPNGTIQDAFWPTAGTNETDFTFNAITLPLAPFKDRLLFMKGLDIQVKEVGPGGPHQKGIGGVFTNHELQEGSFVDGDGSQAGWANGISVDQEVARHIGGQTFLPSLELGVRAIEADVRGRISYSGPGNPMPPVNAPLAAYDRLFAGFSELDESLIGQRRSVIDTVRQQYAALAPKLSAVDQQKLDQHLELVRGIERRMDIAVNTDLCTRPEQPPELEADSEETMQQIAELQGQLLTAAFACDLTRVATLQFSTAINAIRMPWVGGTTTGHALSHAGPSNEEATGKNIAIGAWMAEEISKLMTQLDAIPEGDGTVLDHTMILWGNELGMGNSHTHEDIPFLLAGGTNDVFRMGRFVDYGGKSHAGLLVALLNAMGVDAPSFGHPDYADGPLPDMT
jgi:hypothetical protein